MEISGPVRIFADPWRLAARHAPQADRNLAAIDKTAVRMIANLNRFSITLFRLPGSLVAVLLFMVACTAAVAQPTGDTLPTTSGGTTSGTLRGGRMVNGEGGELPIEVNIWGFVRNPGKYTVSASTRLLDLISLAGGPVERADLEEVRVIHDKTVDSSLTELVRTIDVEDYQRSGNPAANPVLYPNDTIVVPADTLNTVNSIFTIISSVTVVTLSVIGLIVAFKK